MNACELSVITDRGKRVEIARELELDWFVDDTLEQCCAVQLETSAVAIWIAATPSLEDRVAAESAGCVIAASLEEAIAVIDDGTRTRGQPGRRSLDETVYAQVLVADRPRCSQQADANACGKQAQTNH